MYRSRVESKLSEQRFAKLEKLFELRNEYLQNMGREGFDEISQEEYLDCLKEGLTAV